MSRNRRIVAAAITAALAVSGPALGATSKSTTKAGKGTAKGASKPTTTAVPGDRIRAEGLVLPPKVGMRRAINRSEPVAVRATLRLSDVDKPVGFSGNVDPQNDVANLTSSFDGDHLKLRLLGEDAYFEIAEVDKPTYLADWFSVPLTSTAVPALVKLAHTVVLRPQLLQSVSSWKETSTAADTTAKLRRYHGTGTVEALTLGDATGFKPGVSVTIWLDADQFVTRLDWEIFSDKSAEGQGVTSTARYTKSTPVSPSKPGGRIADFEKVTESGSGGAAGSAASDGEPTDTAA